jgi:glycosyltransferase involved in cell wall biosynthesis
VPVEVAYTSPLLRRLSHRPGPVIESLIDLRKFMPLQARVQGTRPFTVGRMSRDVATKRHHGDADVCDALARAGVTLRVMGGTSLQRPIDEVIAASLLAAGSERSVDFLHALDCFYYRANDRWLEAFGRVVFEAMACGLPVVCGRRGGYADYIAHGVNGFLFDTNKKAIALILKLRADPALRDRIGRAARRTVEDLYAGRAWQNKLAFFLPSEREPRLPRLGSLGDAFDPTPSRLR